MEMHAASDTIVLSTIAGRWIKATGRWMGRQTGAKQRIDGEQSSVAETYVEIGLTTFWVLLLGADIRDELVNTRMKFWLSSIFLIDSRCLFLS